MSGTSSMLIKMPTLMSLEEFQERMSIIANSQFGTEREQIKSHTWDAIKVPRENNDETSDDQCAYNG